MPECGAGSSGTRASGAALSINSGEAAARGRPIGCNRRIRGGRNMMRRNMMRVTGLLSKKWAARALLVLMLAVLVTAGWTALAWAEGPQPWQLGMQPPATPVKDRLNAFHNELLVIIFLIAIFVMGLLLYVIVRFNHQRNPVPAHTSHNPVIEVIWTVVPVLILVIIAIPSFKLMYYMDRVPNPDMTIK